MSFPRYPAYKDSGVEWLGEVPEHWESVQLGRVVKEIQTGPFGSQLHSSDYVPDETPVLNPSNIQDGRIVPDWSSTVGSEVVAGLEQHILQDGDLLIGRRGEMGRCALVTRNEAGWLVGTGSIKVRLGDVAVPRHFAYYLSTPFARDFLSLESVGSTMENLNASILGCVPVLLPPRPEQCIIATFLDRETAKIDALVAEFRTLIELLKEKRQAVISHAVTKGLDPTVSMKDSGVEWLGEVPEHWEAIALSRITSERCDGPFGTAIKSNHYTDEGARVIRLQNIRAGRFDGTDEAFLDLGYFEQELSGHDVVAGDVLIAGLGDENNQVGRACVAPGDLGPALVKADCFRFRLDKIVAVPSFIAVQLSAGASFDGGYYATGTTRQRIPLSVTGRRRIVLPPVAEQRAIACHIDHETTKLDALVTEAEQATSLLQERRTALISAAVTGKIDVRGLVDRDEAA